MACIGSCLNIMKEHEGGQAISHTTVGFAWRAGTYLLVIVTIAKGSIGLFVPWVAECRYRPSKAGVGSTLCYFLGLANIETPQAKGCFHTCLVFGF